MVQPTDLQTSINAVQWTNGTRAITGAVIFGMFTTIVGVFSGMGTWTNGVFVPNPIPIVSVADANYAIQPTDRVVYVKSLTASRTLSLPAASLYAEDYLEIRDVSNAITATQTVMLAPNGTDTINRSAATVNFYPGQDIRLAPNFNLTGWVAQ